MIYKEYFELTEQHKQQLGTNTIVLMQVGSFYEMYGLKCMKTNEIQNTSNIVAAAHTCFFKIADKKDKVEIQNVLYNVVMAGFGEHVLDKYLPLLVDAGFSCAVYVQEDDMSKRGAKKRVFHGIFSPGTYLSTNETSASTIDNAQVMVIWIHVFKPLTSKEKYVCGFANISCTTGESSMYEYTTPVLKTLSPTSFDELERAVHTFQPQEIVFIHPFYQAQDKEKENKEKGNEVDSVLQYIGAHQAAKVIHKVSESDNKATNACNPAYINALLTDKYGDIGAIEEFSRYEFATQCFCYLLDFMQQHSPSIVDKIRLPSFSNVSPRLILGNHTLTQLNILSFHTRSKLSSVATFLNEANTPMGKRAFHQQLLNPVFDVDWLNQEYAAIDTFMQKKENNTPVAKVLKDVHDIDKIVREIVHGRVSHVSLIHLYESVSVLKKIIEEHGAWLRPCYPEIDKKDSETTKGSGRFSQDYETTKGSERIWLDAPLSITVDAFLQHMEKTIVLTVDTTTCIQPGVSAELDALQGEYEQVKAELSNIREEINAFLGGDHVKWHETAKSGASFQITATRGLNLETMLSKKKGGHSLKNDLLGFEESSSSSSSSSFWNGLHVVKGTSAGADVLQSPHINTLLKRLNALEDKLATLMSAVYKTHVVAPLAQSWTVPLTRISTVLARIDVLQSKARVSMQYGYCRPVINSSSSSSSPSSYVKATQLRHPLIEHLQTQEIYVPNDVSLGTAEGVGTAEKRLDNDVHGILLFGTNAVGKTSLIKALGIAVIMAQAGMYVPCSAFVFYPYRAIYSRILGNDDLFKGLSTFVVEMSELRTILKESTPNTLVLGDEVCSGTETESALSIFTAALIHLYKAKASFLFATHFHEISRYKEVVVDMACSLRLKHMSVLYDAALDCLVYDRRLHDGPGPAIYGLEVAKSLYMPTDFLDDAFRLREKYFPMVSSSMLNAVLNPYNATVVKKPLCEMCNAEVGAEIHHLAQQKEADPLTGMIHSSTQVLHKNHPANLVTVCISCHDAIHAVNTEKKKKVKTTKGTILL